MRKETDGSGKHVSIHLMLLFILTTEIAEMAIDLFQYISCYSLSKTDFLRLSWDISFNTSHVTLYPRERTDLWKRSNVSIHLMLLFIRKSVYLRCFSGCFNTSHVTLYHVDLGSGIICINVSIHLMLLFIINGSVQRYLLIYSFNTSHVTLYLIPKQKKLVALKFQYISCYSLSKPFGQRKNALALFQYISCYSSSKTRRTDFSCYPSFNTSHVTLYL